MKRFALSMLVFAAIVMVWQGVGNSATAADDSAGTESKKQAPAAVAETQPAPPAVDEPVVY